MKKGNNNILTHIKRITLILGILTGFCALSVNNQLSYSFTAPSSTAEDTSENPESSSQVITAIDAISYSSQINVSLHSILLEELPESEDNIEEELEENVVTFSASKALKILFRRIISPNAP
ncbi:MAG: hypothetical protein ACJA08_002490 [Cyclobacteriaceae bacterium]